MHIRTWLLGAAAAAAALALGAATPAVASDNANGTPLYSNVFSCGGAQPGVQTGATNAGFVNFHLDGQTVTVIYHLKGALPDATYTVYGVEGYCTFQAVLGQVTTNDNGVGNATFTYTIDAGQTQVWTFSETPGATSFSDYVESVIATV